MPFDSLRTGHDLKWTTQREENVSRSSVSPLLTAYAFLENRRDLPISHEGQGSTFGVIRIARICRVSEDEWMDVAFKIWRDTQRIGD